MRVTLCALAVLFAASSYGAIIAYDSPVSVGNQSVYNGSLGLDFDVNSTITITSLGVYDSGADGLAREINAYIYDRTTMTAVASLVFTTGNTGTLVNGQRFLTLSTPLTLLAGFQGSVVAENYGSGEANVNNVPGLLPVMNDGGGAISFVGTSRYGAAGVYPINPDSGPENRYGAGTFEYTVGASAIPEPATVGLIGLGLIGVACLRRRAR